MLHTCIGKALDYSASLPRVGNELRCLAVLSNAVQYDPTAGTLYETLLERFGRPDVMLPSAAAVTPPTSTAWERWRWPPAGS